MSYYISQMLPETVEVSNSQSKHPPSSIKVCFLSHICQNTITLRPRKRSSTAGNSAHEQFSYLSFLFQLFLAMKCALILILTLSLSTSLGTRTFRARAFYSSILLNHLLVCFNVLLLFQSILLVMFYVPLSQ